MINYYEFSAQDEAIVSRVITESLAKHGISLSDVDVDITLLNKEEMQQLNNESRAVDKPTDVLSFPSITITMPFNKAMYPYDINPETNAVYLGEMMICREIMAEQATEYGHSEVRELAYLTAHGIHHLLGYDHMTESDRTLMRAAEEVVLNALDYKRL